MKKFKGHFSGPSVRSSHPSYQTRASRSPGLRPPRKGFGAGPRRNIEGAQSKIKKRKIPLKLRPVRVNFQNQKQKSHLPVVNLKFLTQTPNLTSNFEAIGAQSKIKKRKISSNQIISIASLRPVKGIPISLILKNPFFFIKQNPYFFGLKIILIFLI